MSTLRRARAYMAANSRFLYRFRQHVVVAISHQMNTGDAFDIADGRIVSTRTALASTF